MALVAERLVSALSDRYVIERELGRGGMANVFLAHDVKHDRSVALKVMREDIAEALGSDRFLREIRFIARLQHPHILPLYDSGEVEGSLYYVMPCVEGESLRDRLNKAEPLPIDTAIRIASHVCEALAYAHEHNVMHRDIKPENILLSGSHALVSDFGIARAITQAGGEALTQVGLTLGTPAYMSPEQARADVELDGRSDIYSLGCVLYEMLAGMPAFSGPTTQAVIAKHMNEAPTSLSVLRSDIPAWLAAVVARALAKDRTNRFQSAREMLDSLAPAPAVTSESPAEGRRRWNTEEAPALLETAEQRQPVVPRRLLLLVLAGAGAAIILAAGALLVR